jgi:cell wall-associated NlpC family hydrolase
MQNKVFVFIMMIVFTSCSSSKSVTTINKKHSKADKIIHTANSYKGTKYKFGGITNKGVDCSGLIYTAFKKEGILLPRVSRDMALKGEPILLKNIRKGDLVFFITGKKNRINHVGLVIKIVDNEVFFIHASTSSGVIISSLNEKYYKLRFKKVRRVL